MTIANQNYFINKLENNIHNKNKAVFVDGVEGPITRSENNWFFNLSFYIVGDFDLPTNSLLCNFISPIGNVSNIPLIFDEDGTIPDCATWKEKTHVFKSKFTINTKDVDFLKEELQEHQIDFTYGFLLNAEAVKDIEIQGSTEVFECFIDEFNSSIRNTYINFSNFAWFESDFGNFNNINNFWTSTYGSFFTDSSIINFQYIDIEKNKIFPIKNILKFTCDKPFEIESSEIEFNYSIDWIETKKITLIPKIEKSSNNIILKLQSKTLYNKDKKEIYVNDSGIDGFYSPVQCLGKMLIKIKLKTDFEKKQIVFTKEFSFKNQDDYIKSELRVDSAFINNIDNYERMVF